MALREGNIKKADDLLAQTPQVVIQLRPLAPPAALGLAGFAGSTFIVASWIAEWWGDADSPLIFFPFVALFGGLAQFIAGLFGFAARDTLVTVVNTMWGSFWISIGILYYTVAAGYNPPHSIYTHFPELAAWFIVLAAFTIPCAIAALARDLILFGTLSTLGLGSLIGFISWFAPSKAGIKVAAYFFIASSFFAWWRVTVYILEEAFGPESKYYPIFRLAAEKRKPLVVPGVGEPGVKRGMPGVS